LKYKNKAQKFALDIAGYLILLVQQIPGMWVWLPLMAAPVIMVIGTLISNLPTSMEETYRSFFMLNEVFLGKLLIVIGVFISIYSVLYLGVKKRIGLVISGPYRFVRHPQYLGFLLLTIGLTGWSYFYLTNFFGIGWISAEGTIVLWYLELILYIILALIEEKYLLKSYEKEYSEYKAKTPLLFPVLKMGKYDSVISVFVFSIFLYIVIQ
jgi:protein-S-isoprenylcysteine O-methyltransferase Ste14